MTDAILFDFNGVLVDDEELHRQAFTDVLETLRITLTRGEYYAHYLGFDDRLCFVEAFRRSNRTLTGELLNHMVAEKGRHYEQLIADGLKTVPGAMEFVRAAAPQFRLAIVSGARRVEIDAILGRLGLADCFAAIVSAEDVAMSKPDPAGFEAAVAALTTQRPLSARRCVAIEDSVPGLRAAQDAGMACVMLTTSHDEATLRSAGATMVWKSFEGHQPAELAALLA